jgi:hypothetical protein
MVTEEDVRSWAQQKLDKIAQKEAKKSLQEVADSDELVEA